MKRCPECQAKRTYNDLIRTSNLQEQQVLSQRVIECSRCGHQETVSAATVREAEANNNWVDQLEWEE